MSQPALLHCWLGEAVHVVTSDLKFNLIVIYVKLYFNSLHVLIFYLLKI